MDNDRIAELIAEIESKLSALKAELDIEEEEDFEEEDDDSDDEDEGVAG